MSVQDEMYTMRHAACCARQHPPTRVDSSGWSAATASAWPPAPSVQSTCVRSRTSWKAATTCTGRSWLEPESWTCALGSRCVLTSATSTGACGGLAVPLEHCRRLQQRCCKRLATCLALANLLVCMQSSIKIAIGSLLRRCRLAIFPLSGHADYYRACISGLAAVCGQQPVEFAVVLCHAEAEAVRVRCTIQILGAPECPFGSSDSAAAHATACNPCMDGAHASLHDCTLGYGTSAISAELSTQASCVSACCKR